jgi:thiol-disulfide isomerase/thioredoxin
MRFSFVTLFAFAILASPNAVSAQANNAIMLEKIKANEVEKMVAAHKGKVVCVDVWADFCAPCKMKFPHLVQLHKELGNKGLICISLSVDLEENFDGALAFLKKQNATFANYILWDDDEAAKDKLDKTIEHIRVPIFHVFDRDGKKVKTWDGRINEDEIDKLIKDLLEKK